MPQPIYRPLSKLHSSTLLAVVRRNPKGKLPAEVAKLLDNELAWRRHEERRQKELN